MSKSITNSRSFPPARPSKRAFDFEERPLVSFPIQRVEIDWDRLIAKRPMLFPGVLTRLIHRRVYQVFYTRLSRLANTRYSGQFYKRRAEVVSGFRNRGIGIALKFCHQLPVTRCTVGSSSP